MSSTLRPLLLAVALTALGAAQIAGELLDAPALVAWARSSASSPAPGGSPRQAVARPPFAASRVIVQWRDHRGQLEAVELDAARLGRLSGPAPRRALYRLALARGPELVADPSRSGLLDSLLEYALCGDRPLLSELGVDTAAVAGEVSLQYQADAPGAVPVVIGAPCP